jgi:pristinamycin I synthase-3/4
MSAVGILQRLARVAHEHGDRPAVVQGARLLSHRDLHELSGRLAAGLLQAGAGPGAVVALALGRSIEHVAGCLAAWRAGAGFLPLDLAWPDDRLAFVLAEARPAVVLGPAEQVERLRRLGAAARLPDELLRAELPACESADDPERLAWLIYTSGSTGRPKGVEVKRRGLVNLLQGQVAAFDLGPQSRVLWLLSPAFDASVSDIGTALLAGACLFIEPDSDLRDLARLVEVLHQRRITHLDLPPALLRLLDPEAMPASLRTLVIGGEVCPPAVVRRWARRFRVVNVYGPTEATVCTSLCMCDPDTWTEPLLGQPLPGVRYHVLDEELRPVPSGATGELCIAGDCLARGYRDRLDLTARKFITHMGQRLYRTGDLVRLRADGEYVFVGRIDRQVKWRGMLIEPEEIEARLLDHPGVVEAVVLKRPLHHGGPEALVAFVRGSADLGPGEMGQHLRRALPAWMVPSRFVFVPELPRTPTGKIDLDRLDREPLPDGPRRPPQPGTLGLVLEVCGQVLGQGPLDPDAGFFEQGGDSLTLLQAVAALGTRGLIVPPALLADGPLRAAADWLDRRDQETTPGALPAERLRQDVEEVLGQAGLPAAAPRPARPGVPATVLLTGATGFLGSHVLVELLRRTEAEIICLVRGQGARAGHERLRQALARHGLSVRTEERRRLGVLAGDLVRPLLGLPASTWDDLAERVDTLYHLAAHVNLVLGYEALRADNVLGTLEVVRLWATGRPRWLHHVSTLSVFVATDRDSGTLREDDDLARTRWVHGGYAQSKWAAEWLVRRAAGAGGVTHYRPGLITPHSRGGPAPARDFLTLFLRGLSRLGCLPRCNRAGLFLDVTPVDYAARALVHLSLHAAGPMGDCFHLTGPRPVSLAELTAALGRAGIPIAEVDAGRWRERLGALEPEDAAACLALCRALPGGGESFERYRTLDLFQATGVEFDQGRALAGLAGSGIVCPPPDERLLDRYVRAALGDRGGVGPP